MSESLDNIRGFILRAMNFRYACKEYDPYRKISKEDLAVILETARLSPTSLGFMPMKFLVVESKKLREKLLPYCNGGVEQLKTCSHFIIILSRSPDDLKPDSEYISHNLNCIQDMNEETVNLYKKFYKDFYKEKFNNGKDERAVFDWGSKQTYIALGNMMTVASELCIDSCAIEGFSKEEVERVLSDENLLDLNHFQVSVMMSLGYRKEEPHRDKKRPSKDEIIVFC